MLSAIHMEVDDDRGSLFKSRSVIGQRNVTFDTAGKGQAWGHGTPDFDAQSGRGIKKRFSKHCSRAT